MEGEGDDCPISYSPFHCELARVSAEYRRAFLELARTPPAGAGGRPDKPHYRNLDEAIRAKRNCRECKEKK